MGSENVCMEQTEDLNVISGSTEGRFGSISKECDDKMNVDEEVGVSDLNMIAMNNDDKDVNDSFFWVESVQSSNSQKLASKIFEQISKKSVLKMIEQTIKNKEDRIKQKRNKRKMEQTEKNKLFQKAKNVQLK